MYVGFFCACLAAAAAADDDADGVPDVMEGESRGVIDDIGCCDGDDMECVRSSDFVRLLKTFAVGEKTFAATAAATPEGEEAWPGVFVGRAPSKVAGEDEPGRAGADAGAVVVVVVVVVV